jgi:hypothetical protein
MPDLKHLAIDLHLGGIAHVIAVSAEEYVRLVEQLMTCGHSHVFVVDQSAMARRGATTVRLGLSDAGLRCLGLAEE